MSETQEQAGTAPATVHQLTAQDLLGSGSDALTAVQLDSCGGGTVYFRKMPARDVIAFATAKADDQMDGMAKMMCKAICDKEGNRLFDDDSFSQLLDMPVDVWTELATKMAQHTNMSGKHMGEGSGEHQPSDSPTVSPESLASGT